jgi:glycosyltransferase involved in cell wall biosynthesis
MKFSVLLPTRNRLKLLSYAVESVLRQDYEDWEIVISDNCSEEDIQAYVMSLSDHRVKYTRFASFVPVTDNWNNTLKYATAPYVIMLGDDDCLMPGYFTQMVQLLQEFENPDLIFTDANLYAYPGVIKQHPLGYFRDRYIDYFHKQHPYMLSRDEGDQIVTKSLAILQSVHYNMQLSLISRGLIESLADRGPFFQSIFPDFYATVVSFLKSKRTLIYPKPVVTIGISPKSYGVFHFSGNVGEGRDFLYEDTLDDALTAIKDRVLPGDFTYTGWLSAMDTIKKNYPQETQAIGAKVGYNRYRRLQIVYMNKNYFGDKRVPREMYDAFNERLSWKERIFFSHILQLAFRILGLVKTETRDQVIQVIRKVIGRPNILKEDRTAEECETILDVFEKHEEREQVSGEMAS